MENPHEERQNALLERIIKNVDLLADAMSELDRGVREINDYNRDISITGELWEGYNRNASFNLATMDEDQAQQATDEQQQGQQAPRA